MLPLRQAPRPLYLPERACYPWLEALRAWHHTDARASSPHPLPWVWGQVLASGDT